MWQFLGTARAKTDLSGPGAAILHESYKKIECARLTLSTCAVCGHARASCSSE